jgi:branched-chain amino acid transport system permease protein
MTTVPEQRKKRIERSIAVRSRSLYALSSWREMAFLLLPRAALAASLCILPLMLGMYWQRVFCAAAIYAMLALAFDFLAQFVGLVCLGLSMFIGLGGYFSGGLNHYWGWPIWLSIPVASLAGAVLGTLALVPCLRLRGVYFAIISFMLPLFLVSLIIATGILGSTEGVSSLDNLPNIWMEQYLIVGALLLALFGFRRLVTEDFGVILQGIKDNDQAVKASGIDITAYKIKAVFLAALIGSFCGAYLSHLYGWLGLSMFAMDFSILPIAATVMGGMGTLAGPVIGAFILTPLSEGLRGFGQLRVVLYSLLLLGFILYKPEGILNYLARKYFQFERWEKV